MTICQADRQFLVFWGMLRVMFDRGEASSPSIFHLCVFPLGQGSSTLGLG